MNSPNGIAIIKGTLFVAERDRILRFDDFEKNLDNMPAGKVVVVSCVENALVDGGAKTCGTN